MRRTDRAAASCVSGLRSARVSWLVSDDRVLVVLVLCVGVCVWWWWCGGCVRSGIRVFSLWMLVGAFLLFESVSLVWLEKIIAPRSIGAGNSPRGEIFLFSNKSTAPNVTDAANNTRTPQRSTKHNTYHKDAQTL